MLIGHFTEQPWQQADGAPPLSAGLTRAEWGMGPSNAEYDPHQGNRLYHRYLDEKLYAEEVGFDALMLNEHHAAPFCIQSVTNVELAILARQTKKAKLAPLGNVLPLWDDPLWLVEQLAMIDMISHGRLISGFVRGIAREGFTHNANPMYNRERWQEAHDFLIKSWTTPGPFRWESKHFNYRYVNPWSVPLQKPHPPIWVPGVTSYSTAEWCARHGYPYIMLATMLDTTKELFNHYHQVTREMGYSDGPHRVGYMFKVHVEATEEKAHDVARKYLRGAANPNLIGNVEQVQIQAQAGERQWLSAPPGLQGEVREHGRYAYGASTGAEARLRRERLGRMSYEEQVANYQINTGTPKTVIAKVRHILEFLRPGSIFFWDGDGRMDHDDQMRSLRLMGEEVIPAAREIGKELGLKSPFEVNDGTGYDYEAWKKANAAQGTPAAGKA